MNEIKLPESEGFETDAPNTIEQITLLSQSLVALDSKILEAENNISKLKAKRTKIRETLLPDLMDKLGMAEYTLTDGTKVKLTRFYSGKIKGQESKVFAWLRANDHEGIIKNQVNVSFDAGADELATKIKTQLIELGLFFENKIGIHPSTLNSFIKERCLEDDKEFPKEMFGVFEGRRVNISKI